MTGLPLTVIGGYLGAGKTTLINRLLAAPQGRRLMVLVNDFGAINIDASLLQSRSEDTIELTNGCVCCTLAGSLFQAVGDILDRPARPDHLLIEASGISDPARIAHLALAEPDLDYAGIVTVVDVAQFPRQSADPKIADQVIHQVRVADVLALAKGFPGVALGDRLNALGTAPRIDAARTDLLTALLLSPLAQRPDIRTGPGHPDYVQWSDPDPAPTDKMRLKQRLGQRPKGLMRIKGFVPDTGGGSLQVQVVGAAVEVTHSALAQPAGLVAIGLKSGVSVAEIEGWWRG